MKLFSRGRTSRATARVLTVETTDRLDHRCVIEVTPVAAPPFRSLLRTRAPLVPDAITYVLYNPDSPEECIVDEKRLRANGVRDGRAYVSRGWDAPAHHSAPRMQVDLDDAKLRLQELDRLRALHATGHLTDEELKAEKALVLRRPPERVS